ncbi:glucose6-phosphate dehydrogenase, C-terminal domain containing protein [Acanthamoeba castellanii str. Neff]|uniref:Glucose-6-phosphate 1-dehydrogenase n=1 Tax=Acanthamoeba castellanii (strain ATCC 30010 / Neff) TaxID=1257118 RepID=L8HBJ1_ACACF|nr:glucose6-phosphate dehydrogenase, C-terminal domain containing protein [Acanthamoeba castellanii str. Neff]ELR22078.1 glucose6-phosphate dehydrogenase, C-terminal domain containing protein [Acanthamoeba castellanii str. Neff]
MSQHEQKDEKKAKGGGDGHLSLVVLGASGDLAKKMVFPALFALYKQDLLPKSLVVVGHARSELDDAEFKKKISEKFSIDEDNKDAEEKKRKEFLDRCVYHRGKYDEAESFADLDKLLQEYEEKAGDGANRLFYLAIPPSVYADAAKAIREKGLSKKGWNRFVLEKPFGRDAESSAELSRKLSKLFDEEEVYRIDHYLGKEMVQNLLVLRFANEVFEPVWNKDHIANVRITLEEDFGAEGRGGYFDEKEESVTLTRGDDDTRLQFGIIRDVMQNHLIQVLALVAMEPPKSLGASDIQDAKTKVLKSIAPIKPDDILIGQYTASDDQGEKKKGYTDDPSIPNKHSLTPTFAVTELRVNNDRWEGTPFIIKSGKALNDHKSAVYLKMLTKKPGLTEEQALIELDLTYKSRFAAEGKAPRIPGAYERLVLDVIKGDHRLFVRDDELAAAWDIFTPILHHLEDQKVEPIPYAYGSRGPAEADEFIRARGFRLTPGYQWPKTSAL